MALTKEDKKDVSSKFGKALANKVEKATQDKPKRSAFFPARDLYPSSGDAVLTTHSRIERNKEMKKSPKSSALKKKAYTGHYQETGTGQIRHQSPRQVKEKGLGSY